MTSSHRRHDISDRVWARLEPHLPGAKGAGEGWPKTTASSSMRCSGFCAPGRLGAICRPITAVGAILSPAFHPLASSRRVGPLAGELG